MSIHERGFGAIQACWTHSQGGRVEVEGLPRAFGPAWSDCQTTCAAEDVISGRAKHHDSQLPPF